MKPLTLNIDGRTVNVQAEKIRGTIWFHFEGKTYAVEPEGITRRHRSSLGGGSSGDIKAPMPGKIIKVLAKEKSFVKEREPLVVMEAMKMEYTLESTGAGTIEQICCKPGDQVQIGQVLVTIKVDKK